MPEALLAGICLALLLAHIASTAVAMFRCRPQRQLMPPPAVPPKVAVLRPVCGVDTFDESTLRSTFQLDYSRTQLIFCCDRANDAAAHVVRVLIQEFPHVDAKLLIGRDPVTCNPKLNNLLKGWPHVDAEWLIMADSNVEMPKDYVQRLLAGWKPGTGVLCSPPIGKSPVGFWAEIECAFLNTYQARWQYTADSVGWGFAQGKTMMFRRRDLAAAGGLLALEAEVAEDAAATKLVRAMGLSAHLTDRPFAQPLGPRSAVNSCMCRCSPPSWPLPSAGTVPRWSSRAAPVGTYPGVRRSLPWCAISCCRRSGCTLGREAALPGETMRSWPIGPSRTENPQGALRPGKAAFALNHEIIPRVRATCVGWIAPIPMVRSARRSSTASIAKEASLRGA